jgi:uncharacterized protein (DUF2249 family)
MGLPLEATPNEVDLRDLPSTLRHANVLRLARRLSVGTAFVFVTDRNPEPLYYQLETVHRHEFFWNYLDNGPAVWRVQIGRLQSPPDMAIRRRRAQAAKPNLLKRTASSERRPESPPYSANTCL